MSRKQQQLQREQEEEARMDRSEDAFDPNVKRAVHYERAATGRPSKIGEIDLNLVKKMVDAGASIAYLARFLKISVRAIYEYKANSDEFMQALTPTDEAKVRIIENKLFDKALGYDYMEEKVFHDKTTGEVITTDILRHCPPSDGAQKMLLTNLKPEKWRERTELAITESENLIDRITKRENEKRNE